MDFQITNQITLNYETKENAEKVYTTLKNELVESEKVKFNINQKNASIIIDIKCKDIQTFKAVINTLISYLKIIEKVFD